jgi:hypothetical protein
MDRLNYLIKPLKIDIACGCETQCDWRFVQDHNKFLNIIAPFWKNNFGFILDETTPL